MGDLGTIFDFLKWKLCIKVIKSKSNCRVLRKSEVETNWVPVFAPDCSATVLAVKICTNPNEHSMYIRFLCKKSTSTEPEC
jgi:hypothetical protein